MVIRKLRIALLILSALLIWVAYSLLFERQPLFDFKGCFLLGSVIAVLVCNAILLQLKSMPKPMLIVILVMNILYVVAARLDYYRWDLEGQAFLAIPLHILVDLYVLLAAILVILLWKKRARHEPN